PPRLEVLLGLFVYGGIVCVRLLGEVLRRREGLLVAKKYLEILAFLYLPGHLCLPGSKSLSSNVPLSGSQPAWIASASRRFAAAGSEAPMTCDPATNSVAPASAQRDAVSGSIPPSTSMWTSSGTSSRRRATFCSEPSM